MDQHTALQLAVLNSLFYACSAESFSATRRQGWPGWEPVAELASKMEADTLELLDVACGNLRFERYLAERLSNTHLRATAIDNCLPLMEVQQDPLPENLQLDQQEIDVVSDLLQDIPLPFPQGAFDLVVSFGFFHHIPTQQARIRFLHQLLSAAKSGGIVALSLWCFMNAPELAERARATTAQAAEELQLASLDQGDYLLGWDATPGLYRYCHHFSDTDIDELVATAGSKAQLLSRYQADGRTGNLNTYLLFRVA